MTDQQGPYPPQPPYAAPEPPASGSPAPPQWGSPAAPPQPAPWSALAVAGFVSSFFVGVAGLVLSILGLREATRTGKRGRGLAIAGIVIGAADIVLGVVVVIVVAGLLVTSSLFLKPAARADTSPSTDAATFGKSDTLPADATPEGGYQGLTALGWKPQKDSPKASVIAPVDGKPAPAYTNDAGSCFAEVGVYTTDLGSGGEYERSVALLESWLPDGSDDTATVPGMGTTESPAFRANQTSGVGVGEYDVVRAPVTYSDGTTGEMRARVFARDGKAIGIVTSIVCDGELSIEATGREAIGQYMGAAW